MFMAACFRTRYIHTLHSAVYYLCRLGSSRSAPTWRLVSDRHDPSTFSGVALCLKFTSAIPFRDMTSGVTVETVGNDSWRVAPSRQAVTIGHEASSLLRPVTDRVYWTWIKQGSIFPETFMARTYFPNVFQFPMREALFPGSVFVFKM